MLPTPSQPDATLDDATCVDPVPPPNDDCTVECAPLSGEDEATVELAPVKRAPPKPAPRVAIVKKVTPEPAPAPAPAPRKPSTPAAFFPPWSAQGQRMALVVPRILLRAPQPKPPVKEDVQEAAKEPAKEPTKEPVVAAVPQPKLEPEIAKVIVEPPVVEAKPPPSPEPVPSPEPPPPVVAPPKPARRSTAFLVAGSAIAGVALALAVGVLQTRASTKVTHVVAPPAESAHVAPPQPVVVAAPVPSATVPPTLAAIDPVIPAAVTPPEPKAPSELEASPSAKRAAKPKGKSPRKRVETGS